MISLITGSIEHAGLLAGLGRQTFIESHSSSAAPEDIAAYVNEKFTEEQFQLELSDKSNLFRIALDKGNAVGYSKIIPDCSHPLLQEKSVCKMERLYVLQDYFEKKIGQILFNDSIDLAMQYKQKGIWLNVWTGNPRALRFYEKQGFIKKGETFFRISDKHNNPNFLMYKEILEGTDLLK